MAKPTTYDVDPANVSLTGFLSNATGATWTLTATNSDDSIAHQVSIRNDAAVDHSAKTALLTGTGPAGQAQTETINLPGVSATVESTKYFLTLTSVVPSATIGTDTMDIGWVDEISTTLYPLDWRSSTPATYAVTGLAGTCQFDIDETFEDFQGSETLMDSVTFATKSSNQAADVIVAGTANATGVRLKMDSYTNTAELQFSISQAITR
jgi:hypothetical protein